MENVILAFCDPEEEYLQHLSTFLKNEKDFPWELVSFSRKEDFLAFIRENADTQILVSEALADEIGSIERERVILLNENGMLKHPEFVNIHKYQAADRVTRQLIQVYAEKRGHLYPFLHQGQEMRMIGIFSPAAPMMQEGFAWNYAGQMAKRHRCLYLSFAYYGTTFTEETEEAEVRQDLLSLLYFLKTEKQKFGARLKSLCRERDELDYILSAYMGQNLVYVEEQEWLGLFEAIGELGIYEYLILDLREGLQGLYPILQQCSRIYTLDISQGQAQGKTKRYEQLLTVNEMEEVLQKTRKYQLPALYHRAEGVLEWSVEELKKLAEKAASEELS